MTIIMVVVQALALLVAGFVSYSFAARGTRLWKVILGFLLAIPAGFVAALIVGVVIGEVLSIQTTNEATLRMIASGLWLSVFGSIGGVIFGKRSACNAKN
jgi:protein-S-isoprenylcysteine O-methyltransferase Ste14